MTAIYTRPRAPSSNEVHSPPPNNSVQWKPILPFQLPVEQRKSLRIHPLSITILPISIPTSQSQQARLEIPLHFLPFTNLHLIQQSMTLLILRRSLHTLPVTPRTSCSPPFPPRPNELWRLLITFPSIPKPL